MNLSTQQISRANTLNSLKQKEYAYHPHKMVLTNCDGKLMDPVGSYGKYAYWHSYLSDSASKQQSGWYAEPVGDVNNYTAIKNKFKTIKNRPTHTVA